MFVIYLRFCFKGSVRANLSSLVKSTAFLLLSLAVYFSWFMIPHWTVFITFPWGPSSCTLNISNIVYWLTIKLLVAEIISTSSTSTATDHYELIERASTSRGLACLNPDHNYKKSISQILDGSFFQLS